jgi:outer membrane protein OmpA-like peptidoglycan-associated protein
MLGLIWLPAALLLAQPGDTPRDRAIAYFTQARAARTPQEKIPLLKKSLEQEKFFESAWALGNAYLDISEFANAQNAFRIGLEMTTEDQVHPRAQASYMIGVALEKQGQLLQAAEYLKASLDYEGNPDVEKELARVEVAQSKTVLRSSEITKALLASRSFSVRPRKQGEENKPRPVATIDLRVNFSLDRADLTARGREQAEELGKALMASDLGTYKVMLVGHTDRRGSDQHNDVLSLNRAETIRNYLTTHFTGLDPKRLTSEGHGKRELLARGETEDDHAINRRVEVRLVDR